VRDGIVLFASVALKPGDPAAIVKRVRELVR
jgi:hypothetical protein